MTPIVLGGDFMDTSEFGEVILAAGKLGVECEAVAIRITGALLKDPMMLANWLLCKGLEVQGHGYRSVSSMLTGTTPPADNTKLYRLSAYQKSIDVNVGMPSVLIENLDESTDNMALARARQLLGAIVDRSQRKSFEIQARMSGALPQPGSTVQVIDEVGVLEDITYEWTDDNRETLTLAMVDYS